MIHASLSPHLSGTSDFFVNKDISFCVPPLTRRQSFSTNNNEFPAVAKLSDATFIKTVFDWMFMTNKFEEGSILVVLSELGY